MPTNSALIIRPNYCVVTRYGSAYMTQILDSANSKSLPTIDLHGTEATASNFFSNLETQDPILVSILGHGSYNLIACQDGETLLVGGSNDYVLDGRVVYDLSCQSGRDLGASAVANGAISFLGYTEDFWVCLSEGEHSDGGMLNPLQDEVARGFLESHNVAPISYINGSTIENSYYNSQDRFTYWLNVWESIDSGVASLLMWNRDHQILHLFREDPIISTTPTPPSEKAGIAPLALAFAPLLILPLMKKLK